MECRSSLRYYKSNIHPDMHSVSWWATEQYRVYNPFSGTINNQSESLNFVIKQLQEWHESPISSMVLEMYTYKCTTGIVGFTEGEIESPFLIGSGFHFNSLNESAYDFDHLKKSLSHFAVIQQGAPF